MQLARRVPDEKLLRETRFVGRGFAGWCVAMASLGVVAPWGLTPDVMGPIQIGGRQYELGGVAIAILLPFMAAGTVLFFWLLALLFRYGGHITDAWKSTQSESASHATLR